MTKKNIAFVTLFDATITYAQLSIELFDEVNSWFIVSTKKDKEKLNSFGVLDEQILDLSVTTRKFKKSINSIEVRETLAFFEDSRLPISSILNASRTCNSESLDNLEVYMADVLVKIDAFIKEHHIEWVFTEPSDLVQLLSQLVCWKRDVFFGQISLARHPNNRIILHTDCTEGSFHDLTDFNNNNLTEINNWLKSFRDYSIRPAYFKRISNYRSLASLAFSFTRRIPKILKELFKLGELNDLRTIKLLEIHVRNLIRKFLNRNTLLDFDINNLQNFKYLVYFLHVQPERSIDVISPNFTDQLEIIKQLRRSLPWNFDLLVKDHPASDGAQTFQFYSELKKVKGVKLIASSVDSRLISINSLAVATVSGTVAYEMALLNKPAVIFSKVFFSCLPSIYVYGTPELLGFYLRNLVSSERKESQSSDLAILNYLENLYKNSVLSDWDGFYGFLERPTLLSISELIRRTVLKKN